MNVGRTATALLMAVVSSSTLRAATPAIDVLSYRAIVRPDIPARRVSGEVTVRARIVRDGTDVVPLDRGQLTIDQVRGAHGPLAFDTPENQVLVHLPKPLQVGAVVTFTVVYSGAPQTGLLFAPERRQAYTVFATSQWLVCVDTPGDKATLDLEVQLPGDLEVIGSGAPVGTKPGPAGTLAHRFRLADPTSSFLFGFAAGPFLRLEQRVSATTLVFAGDGFTGEHLRAVFRETPHMLRFFAERAGTGLPGRRYAQVLVLRTAGQEAAGLALLSEAYGRAVLDDPANVTLLAHEMAHQWWGQLVTCREWTHFWLNEGFATFLAAAWLEQRFGRAAYDQEIDRARARYARVRQESGDRALVFPNWDRPTADDRTIVYQKGALALHELRTALGDEVFWKGLRAYVATFRGRTVVTDDFQRVMERTAGRSLAEFFDRWVY